MKYRVEDVESAQDSWWQEFFRALLEIPSCSGALLGLVRAMYAFGLVGRRCSGSGDRRMRRTYEIFLQFSSFEYIYQ